MNNYKELKVWQKSVELAIRVYEVTKGFPHEEMYGLISQMRRSAISVPSNIAEGAGRDTDKDFSKFLGISYGSTCELETQLIIAHKVNFVDHKTLEHFQNDINVIQKMNWALKQTLKLE